MPTWVAGPVLGATFALSALATVGCGGHEAHTLKMRTALDEGQPRKAIAALNEEMDVTRDDETPSKMESDNALFVLDRGSIQQSLVQFAYSKRDFEAADKAVDMLDLSSNAGDEIGKYVFSDSAGRYRAPPYEKLLINTMNLLNYLETKDLSGAKVEARRLSVYDRYYRDKLKEESSILGLGSYLAGFTYEKSGDGDEALRYYDEAAKFSGMSSLREPVRDLLAQSTYKSPRLTKLAGDAPATTGHTDDGEILLVVGYGRVPHKIAQRIPIGLALTYVSGAISPGDAAAANKLAAQGLVTWVNFPTMAPERGGYAIPSCAVDGKAVGLEQAVDVSREVRDQWKKVEGQVILSAITRLIARFAVGQGIQAAAGRDNIVGFLASIGTQATLTALDTPDTRSWETLPARVAVARVRVPAGHHDVALDARGYSRRQPVDVPKGGWAVVSLMALR